MEHSISKSKRKINSLYMVASTVGGKIACGLIVVLFLLAVFAPLYLPAVMTKFAAISSDPPEVIELTQKSLSLFIPIMWLVLALFAAACTFRQRNVGVAMRFDEHLASDGNVITYSFHASGDRHSRVSRNVVMADLDVSNVSFDKEQRHWVFEGGVFGHYYRFPEDERMLSMREMEPVARFTIGDHFDDSFTKLMKTHERK